MSVKEGYRIFISSAMKDLNDTRKKIQEIITNTENIPIMAENFIGVNTVKKLIEEKIKSCGLDYICILLSEIFPNKLEQFQDIDA